MRLIAIELAYALRRLVRVSDIANTSRPDIVWM
jgi:hypothetical protein